MLILSEKDIEQILTPVLAVEAVESAMVMYEGDDFHMPPRTHIDYQGNVYLLMPCFIPGAFGSKLVSVFPENVSRKIPIIQGIVVLNDGSTGIPLALMNGSAITAFRTGAIGAVGIKHLTDSNLSTLGVIGAGIQGYHQAYVSTFVRNFSEVFVYDLFPEKAKDTCDKLQAARPGVTFTPLQTTGELVERSEAIITATTSQDPVVPDEPELLKGKTFIGIGSYKPNLREFPDALFSLIDRVFIDSLQAPEEAGDLLIPLSKGILKKDSMYTLGKLINGSQDAGQKSTRFFKSVGMAIFDLVVAKKIYERSIETGAGTTVNI